MAAKQGLSAHFSQASEDAKRAVLQHTPLKSSWFSNLNTTCTIKSAPPRTPEVLSMLSTKSGWLWKRNEQHVWQARWCCVVPHSFLYYFDAGIPGDTPPPTLTAAQQSLLNQAVKSGYGDRPHAGPRSSFNVFSQQAPAAPSSTEDGGPNNLTEKSPTGIIDLECYTSVHRSSENELLLELSGDDSVNPDLRSFYFFSTSEEESVDWTQAFLHNRHSGLRDELEAFREVAAGFCHQLQELHSQLEESQRVQEDLQEECYSVRSAAEDVRRNGFKVLRQILDTSVDDNDVDLPCREAKKAFSQDLVHEMGLPQGMDLLAQYVTILEDTCKEQSKKNQDLQDKLSRRRDSDASQTRQLQQALEEQEQEWQQEKEDLQRQVKTLQQALENSQKLAQDASQDLRSQRMEMTMLQNSTKQRLGELQSHKKILKKEVIDLRQKLDEVGSELSLLKHTAATQQTEVDQERRKNLLLEKHVERMESQVKVQQNMMELMSASGVGSVVLDYPESNVTSPRNNLVMEEAKAAVRVEVDEKSHMSELTEDRTQKHFDIVDDFRTTPRRFPSYIGVEDDESHQRKLETIMSASLPPSRKNSTTAAGDSPHMSSRKTGDSPRFSDTNSTGHHSHRPPSDSASTGTSRLSVAQRARLEADQRVGTPHRIRTPPMKRTGSQGSFIKNLANALSGHDDGSSSEESYSSSGDERDLTQSVSDTGVSDASGGSLSLKERQAIQRAKQLAFLKEQGLIKDDSNLRGGAGASSTRSSDTNGIHRR